MLTSITSAGSDEQLVSDFQQTGDRACLEALIKQHIGKVRAMIYPMVLNHADADDLTQEVFIRVVRAIGGFRSTARFSTWLYRIAMNTATDFLRKKQRRPLTEDDLSTLVDQKALPPGQLTDREADIQITAALALLRPCLRAALTLTAIHGLEPAEAARIEGCATATMYWRIHQARRLLQKKLGGKLK